MYNYESYNSFYRLVQRFTLFRRSLDEEMKDDSGHGLHLKYKKEEKEAILKEEGELFSFAEF